MSEEKKATKAEKPLDAKKVSEAVEKKVESKKSAPSFDVVKKAEAIKASKMPEDQKQKYLLDIGAMKGKDVDAKAIPLKVWVARKKIDKGMLKAYEQYPAAKGVRLATPSEWDEIFKNF